MIAAAHLKYGGVKAASEALAMNQWMCLLFILYNGFWAWQGAKLFNRIVKTFTRVDDNAKE